MFHALLTEMHYVRSRRYCDCLCGYSHLTITASRKAATHLECIWCHRCHMWFSQMRQAGHASKLHTHNTQHTFWLISISGSWNSNTGLVMCQASCGLPAALQHSHMVHIAADGRAAGKISWHWSECGRQSDLIVCIRFANNLYDMPSKVGCIGRDVKMHL